MTEFDKELIQILWAVHQNGIWFMSPIMDDQGKVLPAEKLQKYGMDVQEAEHAIKETFDKHLIGDVPPESEHWRYNGYNEGWIRAKFLERKSLWGNQEAGDVV